MTHVGRTLAKGVIGDNILIGRAQHHQDQDEFP